MVHRISDDPAARRCIFEWPGLARSRIRTGLIVPAGGWAVRHRDLIITRAAQHKLPAIYLRHFVTAGVKLSDFRTVLLLVPLPQFDDAFVPPKVGAHSLTTSERLSAACSIASFHRNAPTISPTLGMFYSTGIGSKRLTRGLARSRMTTIDIRLPLAFEILENQLVECPSCATTVCTM